MIRKIGEDIFWVGKVDWELRLFHGSEYSTHRGTTYNSYLVKDEKTVLIDTVWDSYGREFVENLKKVIDIEKIDYVVSNHAEVDHSGALEELMRFIPQAPIYCTANGVKSLKGHFHKGWNFNPVSTGTRLNLGKRELIFFEAPMLHWPDSMFCYLTGEKILFSNDAFGHHYASELLYNDLVNQGELFQECLKYYANILTPFSPLVEKKISELASMNLPLEMICPSHGVIWRKNPLQIVGKYLEWAREYKENQITVVYDTMWKGTKKMAEAIVEGLKAEDEEVEVKIFKLSGSDKNDVITEVFKSKAILVGSPTINKGILSSVAAFLEMVKGLRFRGKKAASFGTYGWSGESIKMIKDALKDSGFEILNEGLKVNWNPDKEALQMCFNFGKDIASQTKIFKT